MKDEHIQFLEGHLKKLETLCCKYRRMNYENLFPEHPDAITLTEANDNMPVQINLNDPSLPVPKQP